MSARRLSIGIVHHSATSCLARTLQRGCGERFFLDLEDREFGLTARLQGFDRHTVSRARCRLNPVAGVDWRLAGGPVP